MEGPANQAVLRDLEPLDSTTRRDTGTEALIRGVSAKSNITVAEQMRTLEAQEAEPAIEKERTHPTEERIPAAMLVYL